MVVVAVGTVIVRLAEWYDSMMVDEGQSLSRSHVRVRYFICARVGVIDFILGKTPGHWGAPHIPRNYHQWDIM